jgi:hypothetical protein
MPIDFLRIVGGAGSIVWQEWIAKKRWSWWLLSENFQHWPPLFLPIISRTNTYKYKRRSFGASSPQSFWCSNRYVRVNAQARAGGYFKVGMDETRTQYLLNPRIWKITRESINNRAFFWKLCTEALPGICCCLLLKVNQDQKGIVSLILPIRWIISKVKRTTWSGLK